MTINPALILILGAIPIPLLRGPFRACYLLILPLIGLGFAFSLEPGLHWWWPSPIGTRQILGTVRAATRRSSRQTRSAMLLTDSGGQHR